MAKASEKKLTGRSIAGGADNHQKHAHKRTSAAAMMESVFACKWSARILSLIRDGVNRPGAITRGLDGLTNKVLNECLRRLIGFGLLERMSYPEIPPRALDAGIDTLYGGFAVSAPFQYVVVICHQKAMQVNLE